MMLELCEVDGGLELLACRLLDSGQLKEMDVVHKAGGRITWYPYIYPSGQGVAMKLRFTV